jgi:hypothetical protein
MAISHINGVAIADISHINGIAKASLSHFMGQELPAGAGGIAEVGAGSQRATAVKLNNTDSHGVAFPGNVAIGNLLVVSGAYYGNPASIAVTDTRSTSYTVELGGSLGGVGVAFIAYGIAPSSGACTVTVDPAGASGSYGSFCIDEFSGVHATPLDSAFVERTDPATTTALVEITTVAADALVVAVTHVIADTSHTPTGGWTEIGELTDNAATYNFNTVFQIVTDPDEYIPTWTIGGSTTHRSAAISFKPA